MARQTKGRKKSLPLRLDPRIYAAMQRWADDELRSLNAQIEWVLREALRRAGRLPRPQEDAGRGSADPKEGEKR
ncbi:MAG: hypothetical protein KatS3mg119_0753 [Rhodothalassiaceae bacterium]|nr:MAG: hypothetical protein KatS3mg119_0753 [Rhodothalassiaceae bacterium]